MPAFMILKRARELESDDALGPGRASGDRDHSHGLKLLADILNL